jgi:DNA-binding transcriptional LysR family regulator
MIPQHPLPIAGELTPPATDVISIFQAIVVAEQLSFRRAAAVLGVRQSAVSRRVRLLEDELGVSLFERHRRGVRVTQAGLCFFERARVALEQLQHAVSGANDAGRGRYGRLRIGVFTSLASGFLANLVRIFRESHPDVMIELLEGARRSHLADLRTEALDVVFITGAGAISGCETTELWSERVHVALPVGHPLGSRDRLDWADLKNERFIVSRFPPGPEIHDYVVRRFTDFNSYPAIGREGVAPATIINLVGLGFGIGLVAAGWTGTVYPGVVFRPLTDPADIVPFSAVWMVENDNPVLRRFITAAHLLAGRVRPGSSDWANGGASLDNPPPADEA